MRRFAFKALLRRRSVVGSVGLCKVLRPTSTSTVGSIPGPNAMPALPLKAINLAEGAADASTATSRSATRDEPQATHEPYPEVRFDTNKGAKRYAGGFPVFRFRWADVTPLSPQSGRFLCSDGHVLVAATPERDRIVTALHQKVVEESGGHDTLYALTGVGGNGKSHNLVRLVLRLRSTTNANRGNVVTFVHNAHHAMIKPTRILSQLRFGVQQYAAMWEGDAAVRAKLLADVDRVLGSEETIRAGYSGAPDVLNKIEYLAGCVDDVKNVFKQLYGGNAPRFVMVLDQDNELFRVISGDGDDSQEPNARIVVGITASPVFDAAVLSASANNEGWRRSEIADGNEFVHKAERLPRECAALLFPEAFGCERVCASTEEVAAYTESELGGYPMAWGWASSALLKSGHDPIIEGTTPIHGLKNRAVLFVAKKCNSFAAVLSRIDPMSQHNYAMALRPNSPFRLGSRYDQNLFEVVALNNNNEFVLKAIFPLARKMARAHFQVRLADQLHVSRFNYLMDEAGFNYEQLVLAVIQSDLKLVHDLSLLDLTRWTPCPDDFARMKAGGLKTMLMRPPRETPAVDAYVVQTGVDGESGRRWVSVVALQATCNTSHRDSFELFCARQQPALGDATMLDHIQSAMSAAFPGANTDTHVDFVWIHSNPEITCAGAAPVDWSRTPKKLKCVLEGFAQKDTEGNIENITVSRRSGVRSVKQYVVHINVDDLLERSSTAEYRERLRSLNPRSE